MKKINIIYVVLIAITTVSLALIQGGCNSDKQPTKPIRIGYLNIMAGIPLLVAQEQGLFAKEGVEVTLVEFKTGNEVATAAVSGDIDVIGGAASNAVLDSAQASGKTMKLFLANEYAVKTADHPSTDLLIGGKGIKKVADLKGKTIGIFPGSVGKTFSSVVFPKLGLPLDQIKIVEIPAAQMLTALRTGTVDAITALEPQATTILASGDFNILVEGYYAQVMPQVPASGSWFIDGRLTKKQENSVANAMYKAVDLVKSSRVIADKLLVQRMNVTPELAPKTPLLIWSPSSDPATRIRLNDYFTFMKQNGLTSFQGTNWIWQP
ncbi:MAG: ABC transporter substrate-binding protein [Desulfuromonadales bacterium]|nr:ABC transporter substrate-binding protein [Desulfuromonadales bacterium]